MTNLNRLGPGDLNLPPPSGPPKPEVFVERDLGSDGEPTGRYVFIVGNHLKYYFNDFDAARMEFLLEEAGYGYRDFEIMVYEMGEQYLALVALA